MDITIYVIGLVAFIAFLIMQMVSSGSDRNNTWSYRHQQSQRNYNRNRRRDYDENDNQYHLRHEDEFGGVGMFIGIAFLLLIGYGVYYYNEGKPNATTDNIEVPFPYQDSTSYDQRPDQGHEEDFAIDYSFDDYTNKNDSASTYGDDGVNVVYHPQEYKDAAEQRALESTPTSVETGTFYALIHIYGNLENAIAEQQKWIDKGYNNTKVEMFDNKYKLYYVLVGGFFSALEAKDFMGKKYDRVYDLAGN